jgi:hypothetical protein
MLDPHHLVDLARFLASTPGAGAPRQVVLRRAASTAYYAVFHALAGGAAATFVTANHPKSRALFYRALEHGKTKDKCIRIGKNPLEGKEGKFFPFQAFCPQLRSFANDFVTLQELRHSCDYDPDFKVTRSQAQKAADDADRAIANLDNADPDERNLFLAYLLFGIRS